MNNKSTWEEALKSRPSFSFKALRDQVAPDLFVTSPTDIGVMRNGGKRGARFAPETLLNCFSKLAAHNGARKWSTQPITNDSLEKNNFIEAQGFSKKCLKETLLAQEDILERIVHIGGGHDHVYPLVSALAQINSDKDFVVINIDAHLDSRTDSLPHSGTPFRQLSEELGERLHLYQIGIHDYANTPANFSNMPGMKVAPSRQIKNPADWLIEVLSSHSNEQLILSLDCDGLDQSFMPAVSAPNHNGLSSNEMDEIQRVCQSYWNSSEQTPIFGLYEYNPVLDNIGTTSGRYLTNLIYQFLYP